jgi:hypothetical protein
MNRKKIKTKPGLERTIKTFTLVRDVDESGISGTGVVAEGVEFSDGECVIKWLTSCTSTGIYHSLKAVESIHGHGGKTRVVFDAKATD